MSVRSRQFTTPTSSMALLESTSSPPSFLALPTEIHNIISSHLEFFDLHSLRLTCHYFHSLVPRPTHTEILKHETTAIDFLACVGCTRLRPATTFSAKIKKKSKAPSSNQAYNRFCIECGRRPLPGVYRYTLGSRWEEHGVPVVRCLRCGNIARGPEDKTVELCLLCYRQNLQRVRVVEEQEMVWRGVDV